MSKIPKKMHHIWVGEKEPPYQWINTWKEKHPTWEYKLWRNEDVYGRKWKNQALVDHYTNLKWWHGVADVVRYEILNEEGGFMSGADAVCLHPIDELVADENYDIFSVYENEICRKGLLSPIQASSPDNWFLKKIIENLGQKRVGEWGLPWKTTGNLFMKEMVEKYKPKTLKIWPSYTLIPVHYTGLKYRGVGKIYAEQKFGTTNNLYK